MSMLIAQQAKRIMTAVGTQGRRKVSLPEIPTKMARPSAENSAGWITI